MAAAHMRGASHASTRWPLLVWWEFCTRAHALAHRLCSQVLNRLQPGSGPQPGGWEPLVSSIYPTCCLFINSHNSYSSSITALLHCLRRWHYKQVSDLLHCTVFFHCYGLVLGLGSLGTKRIVSFCKIMIPIQAWFGALNLFKCILA